MKKIFTVLFCLAAGFAVLADDGGKPGFSAEATVSRFVEANECYVLLLLEGTGENMMAAKADFDKKYNAFAEAVKTKFPQAVGTVIAVNYGTRDFGTFRLSESPFAPSVLKVLLFTIPADEKMALELLDCGMEHGLAPFCGASPDGRFGAVFFGLKDPAPVLDSLYPQCFAELSREVENLAKMQNISAETKAEYAARSLPLPQEAFYEVQYKEIKVTLPSEFCSTEKDQVKVTLQLSATF